MVYRYRQKCKQKGSCFHVFLLVFFEMLFSHIPVILSVIFLLYLTCLMSCSGILQKHRLADSPAAVYESYSARECGCSDSCTYQPERNIVQKPGMKTSSSRTKNKSNQHLDQKSILVVTGCSLEPSYSLQFVKLLLYIMGKIDYFS